MALGSSMLVCFLLKRTSGHLNSKGFLKVFLMTRATQKEQATTSLKTNSMNVNHVEYNWTMLQERFVTESNLSQVSTAATCWNSENGFCRSRMEYFNLHIAKYGWRNLEVGCCENRSQTYTQLDNSSTLLFILDNSGLKIGNCCWLVLLSVFPARLFW